MGWSCLGYDEAGVIVINYWKFSLNCINRIEVLFLLLDKCSIRRVHEPYSDKFHDILLYLI